MNLNIWSPADSSDAKLPVVMWSYPAGSTADVLFDGGGMADKGIVFVNYNYGTGSFGWLSHPALSEEFEKVPGSNSSGNWGMLDQFAALKWIRNNIEALVVILITSWSWVNRLGRQLRNISSIAH